MRRARSSALVACASILGALVVLAPASWGAESPSGIRLGPGSELWLEGTSNLHDFTSRTTTVTAAWTASAGAQRPASPADLVALVRGQGVGSLDVEVPVTSLHSGKA